MAHGKERDSSIPQENPLLYEKKNNENCIVGNSACHCHCQPSRTPNTLFVIFLNYKINVLNKPNNLLVKHPYERMCQEVHIFLRGSRRKQMERASEIEEQRIKCSTFVHINTAVHNHRCISQSTAYGSPIGEVKNVCQVKQQRSPLISTEKPNPHIDATSTDDIQMENETHRRPY